MIHYLTSDLQGETVENIKNFNLTFQHLMKFRTQAHLKDLLALSLEANNLAFKSDLLTILTEQGKCFIMLPFHHQEVPRGLYQITKYFGPILNTTLLSIIIIILQ